MVLQRNRWIHLSQEFIGFFDAPCMIRVKWTGLFQGNTPLDNYRFVFLSFVLSKKHGYHTLLPSTSTSGFLSSSFSVIKLLSYWMSSRTTPLQVVPCPQSLVPLNRSVSDEPGPNVDAPGSLLVATGLSKVVYCTLIEPKPSLDTSRGGSPR